MTPQQAARKMRQRSFAEEEHCDAFGPPPEGYEKLWKIPHEFTLALADILENRGVTPYSQDEVPLIVHNVIRLGAEFLGMGIPEFMEEVHSWDDDQLGGKNGEES